MNARRLNLDSSFDEVVAAAAAVLKNSGIILYPTDTIYGIGCRADDAPAIERITALKQRPAPKPMIVLIADEAMLGAVITQESAAARALREAFWPGPLTLLYRPSSGIPPAVYAGAVVVGIRIPANPFCRAVSKAIGVPITSTSANVTEESAASTVDEMPQGILDGVDLIIDAGPLRGAPSTLVDAVSDPPVLLREGSISFEEVRKVVPMIQRMR
jgi:L-threonylcarbamoyladenylate synthase